MSSKDKGKGKKTGASGIGGCDEEEEEEGRVDCRFPSILDGKSITLKSPQISFFPGPKVDLEIRVSRPDQG